MKYLILLILIIFSPIVIAAITFPFYSVYSVLFAVGIDDSIRIRLIHLFGIKNYTRSDEVLMGMVFVWSQFGIIIISANFILSMIKKSKSAQQVDAPEPKT